MTRKLIAVLVLGLLLATAAPALATTISDTNGSFACSTGYRVQLRLRGVGFPQIGDATVATQSRSVGWVGGNGTLHGGGTSVDYGYTANGAWQTIYTQSTTDQTIQSANGSFVVSSWENLWHDPAAWIQPVCVPAPV